MIGLIEIAFWASVLLIIYPYLLYPALIALMGMINSRPVRKAHHEPSVTILIPAYNEVDCIGATIQNKLELSYPKNLLQILVVSDGSDDGTDGVIQKFAGNGVELLRCEGREGKAAALNAAVKHARGEIVVFSDANSLFSADALRFLMENFADPEVGYVTGSLQFSDDPNSGVAGTGGGVYLRYENSLRLGESKVGSIIGVNGGVDAIRRDLYTDIPKQLITDFVLPLTVIAGGGRVIYEPRALAREMANTEVASEFRMRVRVALRALQGMAYMRHLFDPFRYPLTFFCLLSHKVIRYLAFIFVITAFVANCMLAIELSPYRIVLGLHISGYVLALLGLYVQPPGILGRLAAAPSYLLMSYAAFAIALFRFMRGDTMATWKPRAG